jgi:hypothetical protein
MDKCLGALDVIMKVIPEHVNQVDSVVPCLPTSVPGKEDCRTQKWVKKGWGIYRTGWISALVKLVYVISMRIYRKWCSLCCLQLWHLCAEAPGVALGARIGPEMRLWFLLMTSWNNRLKLPWGYKKWNGQTDLGSCVRRLPTFLELLHENLPDHNVILVFEDCTEDNCHTVWFCFHVPRKKISLKNDL